jgi:hypothetical protein
VIEENLTNKIITENIQGLEDCFDKYFPDEELLNSHIVNVSDIDLTKPHGLLGEMCTNMKAQASRRLDLSYPLYGLHLLSLVAGKNCTYENSKLNLFTIFISESGSGKELPISYLANVANQLKLSQYIYDKPRSDKDMIVNLVEGEGKAFYLVDEVHGMFNSINSKQAQSYQANIGDELLKMMTSTVYSLSGLHKREFKERALKDLSACIKQLNNEVCDKKIAQLEIRVKKIECSIDSIENGFTGIKVSFAGVSTPKNIDSLVCESNIESGLNARSIIVRNNDGREPLTSNPCSDISLDVLNRLSAIKNKNTPIKADEQAISLLDYIRKYYDQDKYRNDDRLGALYARIYERVKILSSLMAQETGEISLDDCRYALALSLRHIEDCSFLATQSLSKDSLIINPENLTKEITARVLRFSKAQKSDNGLFSSLLKQKVAKPFNNNVRKKSMFDGLYNNVIQSLIIMGKIKVKGSSVIYMGE